MLFRRASACRPSFTFQSYHFFPTHTIDLGSAWVFFKLMNVSGAEAVVAAGSPFIGQGESACLVKPYVDLMTESEIHLVMTSGTSALCSFPVLRAISQ